MRDPFPGLKPWAVLSDHFMVKNYAIGERLSCKESNPTLNPEEPSVISESVISVVNVDAASSIVKVGAQWK